MGITNTIKALLFKVLIFPGSGSGSMGKFIGANYIIDPRKVRNFVIPDLTGFPVSKPLTL
jgi:hypothetical protein